jgi:nucleoside triphosphate pyrophosphatase
MRELRAILLGSASPRRRELLGALGLRVLVMPSDVDEGDRPGTTPRELAEFHARAKAAALLGRVGRSVLVTADTVVDIDGRALGKPADPAEARAMLRMLAGRDHLVHTAMEAVDGETERRVSLVSTTRVWFAPLDDDAIDAYVASGDAFDKAGSYGIQGRGAALVDRIDGDFYTVMGLPLGAFVRALPQLGRYLPHDAVAVAAAREAAAG